jgi:hypothetical protein
MEGFKMSEKIAYQVLKSKVFKEESRAERIENYLLSGTPDVNYCIDGREGWIEIKSPKEPKRETTKLFASNHNLSQDQKNWILRQVKAGGLCWIFIATEKRFILIDGAFAEEINELTLLEIIEKAEWHAAKPVEGEEHWNLLKKALKANSKRSHTTTS